ncbi:MAG: pseudouridine synthase, partial [Oscillospiraceae bacterium]
LPEALSRRGLFPAGRLDKYSEGMMVLTDDGNFAHRLLSPNRHVPKTYYVEVDQPVVTPQLVLRFREGVFLGDGEHASPAHLEMLSSTSANVTIFEGLYHQVRRMFDHNGAHVTRLVRIRMGNLDLDPMLAAGQCRLLTEMERTQLLGPF